MPEPCRRWKMLVLSNTISILLTVTAVVLWRCDDDVLLRSQTERQLQQVEEPVCCRCIETKFPSIAPASSSSPSSDLRRQLIVNFLSRSIDPLLLNDPLTPHGQALDWIVDEDGYMEEIGEFPYLQRYVLALFYFTTTQEQPWLSCNAPMDGESSDCTYQRVYPGRKFTGIEATRWLSATPVCEWAGVECEGRDASRALYLIGQQIRGPLLPELSLLLFDSIILPYNELYGSLPVEYGEMENLADLELQRNMLTGTIPQGWHVRTVGFGTLALFNNLLSGTISPELSSSGLGGRSRLNLILFDNLLSGTIPTELGRMSMLRRLFLDLNFLTGTLPTELANLWRLYDLGLGANEITGTIPDLYYTGFSQLQFLRFIDCQLTGTISSLIGQMSPTLSQFHLTGNNFSGTLPTEIAELPALTDVWVESNDFTGTVPLELCELVGSEQVESVISDCALSNLTGVATIECACCSVCCQRTEEGQNCVERNLTRPLGNDKPNTRHWY